MGGNVVIRCHRNAQPYFYSQTDDGQGYMDLIVCVSPLSGTILTALETDGQFEEADTTFQYLLPSVGLPPATPPLLEYSFPAATLPDPALSFTIEGETRMLVDTPWSSCCFLNTVEDRGNGTAEEALKLIRFHPDTASATVHILSGLPHFIDSHTDGLSAVTELAFDDHLGVLIVLDDEGLLTSIFYG